MSIRVLLPQPLGPTTLTNSPGRMGSVISVRAWTARFPSIGNTFVTRSMSIATPRSPAIRESVRFLRGAQPSGHFVGSVAGRNSYV